MNEPLDARSTRYHAPAQCSGSTSLPSSGLFLAYPAPPGSDVRALKRVVKIIAITLAVAIVVACALIGYLLTSNPQPRAESEGWARIRADLPRPRGEVGST